MSEHKNPPSRVQVYVRERPYTKSEIASKKPSVIKDSNQNELFVKYGSIQKNYSFDGVFGCGALQAEVYDVVVRPLVDSMLLGCTCTVFAYGAIETGKTYTMIGDDINPSVNFMNDPSVGMVPRAGVDIFNKLSQLGVEYNVTASFVEIHNEEIRDLLGFDGSYLRICDDPDNEGATYIKGLSKVPVNNCNALFETLIIGASSQNSGSHTIFTIAATIRELSNGDEIVKSGKIHLIDLAGCENLDRSGATGANKKSLQTLAKVIKALALKSEHIPYGESKLTRILQDSLGGKSKTSIIATFSPSGDVFEETLSTLGYAHMARSVFNCPIHNVINIRRDNMIKALKHEVSTLLQELNVTREEFYIDAENYEKLLLEAKAKHERVVTLTTEITRLDGNIKREEQCSDELEKNLHTATLEAITKKLEQETIKQEESEHDGACMSDNLSQLEEQSRVLQDVSNQNYEAQSEATLHNAKIANEMVSVLSKNLKNFECTLEQFRENEQTDLTTIATSNGRIKDTVLNDLKRLKQLLRDVAAFTESLKCSFETLFKDTRFTERGARATLTSTNDDNHKLLGQYFEKVKATLGRLKDYIDIATASLAEATFQYENDVSTQFSLLSNMYDRYYSLLYSLHANMQKRYIRIKRLIIQGDESVQTWETLIKLLLQKFEDLWLELETIVHAKGYVKRTTDLLKKETSAVSRNLKMLFNKFMQQTAHPQLEDLQLNVKTAQAVIQEEQGMCIEMVSENHRHNQDYFARFFNTITKGVEDHNEGVVEKVETMAKEAFSMLQNQHRITGEHSKRISTAVDNVIMNENRYTARVMQISQQTVENLEETVQKIKKEKE
ncbi:kinesin-like protein KIF11-B [Tribolium madens]|uniref:kinesin-like protein KIF11-B n=1 Tax=Tribolium madens TaxID=41895 RepID=UPI001CF76738|nr:kinesin-like protein KIF11-B [Tribolium madens]